MIAANTSYKQNGVPVSIPSGSYGIAPLTVHQYEYPKGHPCHNCPYTLRTSVPSCMFPERRDGGCLWYAQLLEEKKKAYGEYRRSRDEMRELLTAKANVDRILNMEAEHDAEKEKDHGQR